MISKTAHEAALESVRVPSSASAVLRAIHKACNYATGVGKYALAVARLAWRTKLPQRTVEWALRWLRELGWIYVAGRGEHRGNVYSIKLPSQVAPAEPADDGALDCDVSEHVEPAEAPAAAPAEREPERSWLGRFVDRVRDVVAGPPAALPEPRAIVPFTGGFGPEPTLMRRPRFDAPRAESEPDRGSAPWVCACGWSGTTRRLVPTPAGGLACPWCGGTGGLEMLPPVEPEPERDVAPWVESILIDTRCGAVAAAREEVDGGDLEARGSVSQARECGVAGERRGGLRDAMPWSSGGRMASVRADMDLLARRPDPDVGARDRGGVGESIEAWQERNARDVGPLYASREEALAAAQQARDARPPWDPLPPPSMPHRRAEMLWRRHVHADCGRDFAMTGEDRDAIRYLLTTLGLDETERLFAWAWRVGRRVVPLYLAGLRGWVARQCGNRVWAN